MNTITCFLVITFNVLSGFVNPFEFDGCYSDRIDPLRKKIFEKLMLEETVVKNLTDEELDKKAKQEKIPLDAIEDFHKKLITEAKKNDLERGPTLEELLPEKLLTVLQEKLKEVAVSEKTWKDLQNFYEKHKQKKIFSFIKHSPEKFLSIEKRLPNIASLPIVGSLALLPEKEYTALSQNLLDQLITKKQLSSLNFCKELQKSLNRYSETDLKSFLGEDASLSDLELFTTPIGELIYYWIYESLHLYLITDTPSLLQDVNLVKEHFAKHLADPTFRTQSIKEDLLNKHPALLFLQECDRYLLEALTNDSFFLPIQDQNMKDGTLVLLEKDQWEEDYQVIPVEEYKGYKEGKVNIVLAKQKSSSIPFLLASCHGASLDPSDGRKQISIIMKKYRSFQKNNPHLQLIIGIDANTKSQKEVEALYEHLDSLHLVCTKVGATTIKRRMITTEQEKAGIYIQDQEEYLITLGNQADRLAMLSKPFLRFDNKEEGFLPNPSNLSDHYPVGAYMIPVTTHQESTLTK